jgi:hypothetical protein
MITFLPTCPQQGPVGDVDPQLLSSADPTPTTSGDLNATLNAHGLYNAFQFVLRLSPAVHQKISELTSRHCLIA